jgi:hypothetical protein
MRSVSDASEAADGRGAQRLCEPSALLQVRACELPACLVVLIGSIPVWGAAAENTSRSAADDLVRTIHVCASEGDDARRLACYDKAANRTATQQPTAKELPLAKDQTREQRFGLSAAQVLQKEHLAQPPKEMTAQVVGVRQPPQGTLMLTLSNGQVWAEESQDSDGVSVSVGDTVTVTHEMMGGFLLTSSASGHRSTRVKRFK